MRRALVIATLLLPLTACVHSPLAMPTVPDVADAYAEKQGEPCVLMIDHPMCDDLVFPPPPAEDVTRLSCRIVAKNRAACRFRVRGERCEAQFTRERGRWFLARDRRFRFAVKCRD